MEICQNGNVSVKSSGVKLKVVEQGDVSIKSLLQRSNPHNKNTCSDAQCKLCTVSEGGEKRGVM